MRLQVAVSHAGLASRRKSASLIKDGKVRVNGKVIREPGFRVDASKDTITCSGKACGAVKAVYILLNKPRGVITTMEDTRGRRTVRDIVRGIPYRLNHAGRLDKESSGLLLLTNDGEVAYRLTHPKFEIERAYEAAISGRLDEVERQKLTKGVYIDRRRTSPCDIRVLKRSAGKTVVLVRLREGRKRQIRNMFEHAGHTVLKLKRLRFGPLELRGLKPGEFRELNTREIKELKKAIGLET